MICRCTRAAATLACLFPATAAAHGTVEGIQGFYAGVLHPLAIPAHLVTLVGVGFLTSQRPSGQVRLCLVGFVIALLVGLGVTVSSHTFRMETAILAVALMTGLVLAIIPVAPKWLATGLCLAAGLLIGMDSNPEQTTLRENLTVGAGILAGCVVLTSYLIVIEKAIKVHWKLIALRVLGSWIAAASAMVIALRLV